MSDMSINIPQVIAVVLIGYLAVRWLRSTTPATTDDRNSTSGGAGRPPYAAQVEQLHQMFPQYDRRTLLWDLQQNGGRVPATTNRILEGRALDTPPPSFQPRFPQSASGAQTPATRRETNTARPDLITRYNLASKLETTSSSSQQEPVPSIQQTQGGVQHQTWASDRDERAEKLRRRRDDMILAARRAMQDKDRSARAS